MERTTLATSPISLTLLDLKIARRLKFKRSEVAKDDILDALVGMVVAITFDNKLKTLPASSQLDSRGTPMEIVNTEQTNDYAL